MRDDQDTALGAFKKSCARILKADPARPFSGDIAAGAMADWQAPCRAADAVAPGGARAFFEQWFAPYAARGEGIGDEGLFTGYYEASLRGSLTRHDAYQYPLHLRPADLVMVELGEFRDELKGQRIAGRVVDGKLKPYEDRAQIVAGQWPHNGDDAVLLWVDDPVDAFFLHIQGSGAVDMDDGRVVRVGYDGQNGHVYYAIGRELVKRGEIAKEDVSMQSIRAWLEAHPDQALTLMNLNKSYVFLRRLDGDGPLGAEHVVLTPGRSLAVDSGKMAYGVPVWLDAAPPVAGQSRIERLMVAQDTGGAIRGAVRGDVFFGHGETAETLAGQMKARGRYWLLLPKTIQQQ
jgi:membrane-bound lytic murein transglycosylase A